MLEALAGRTHEVVSGLCLRTPGWEVVEHEVDACELSTADCARPGRLRRVRRMGGPGRRICDPGARRRPRRAHRRRLPERRRPSRRAPRQAALRTVPRRFGFGSRAAPQADAHLSVSMGLLGLPQRIRRARHGGGSRHREHARLRARARHRALRAVGGRHRPAHGRGPRGRASRRSACSAARPARSPRSAR